MADKGFMIKEELRKLRFKLNIRGGYKRYVYNLYSPSCSCQTRTNIVVYQIT